MSHNKEAGGGLGSIAAQSRAVGPHVFKRELIMKKHFINSVEQLAEGNSGTSYFHLLNLCVMVTQLKHT